MIVVCIDGDVLKSNDFMPNVYNLENLKLLEDKKLKPLTKYRSYVVTDIRKLDESSNKYCSRYRIFDDNGCYNWYSSNKFISLDEFRNNQIDKIL